MLIGLPGSGKSTYAKKYLLNDNTVYLASDDLRIEMFGFEDQTHNEELFNKMNKRCKEALQNGKDVIYDATNLARKRRKHFISTVCKGFDVDAILFCCPIDIIQARNITREERHLPDDKLEQLISNIDVPVYYEGFKNIYIFSSYEYQDLMLSAEYEKTYKYNQYNPHHNKTLGGHIDDVLLYIFHNFRGDRILETVAMFHDLGKMYTRVFDEDLIAHYYRHEKVSAYLYACHIANSNIMMKKLQPNDYDEQVLLLITHHMDLFNPNTTKLKLLLGDDLYNLLEKFHEADKYREEL
jgi:predicted kinase